MTRFVSRFVFGVSLFVTFLVPSIAGAWTGLFTETKVVSGKVVRTVNVMEEDGTVRPLFEGSGATWTPEGEILFVRDDMSIHVANTDGKVRPLGLIGTSPVMSENFLAFNLQRGNRTFTSVVPRAGGEPVLLGLGEGFPAISPDENVIVFDDGSTGLVVSSVKGGGTEFLVRGENPTFLSDGRLLYLDDFGQVPEIRVMDLGTRESAPVVGSRYYTVSSNSWIIYLRDRETRAVRPDGSGDFLLKDIPFAIVLYVYGILRSPEDPRPVEPRGKAATIWGQLKWR